VAPRTETLRSRDHPQLLVLSGSKEGFEVRRPSFVPFVPSCEYRHDARPEAREISTGARYHRTSALPHRKPDPNAVNATRSPGRSRPLRTHSSSAIGIVAAVVLPYHWMLL
jgi:hypothetical protein